MTTRAREASRRARGRETSARTSERRAANRRRDRKLQPVGLRVSASGVRFGLFCFKYLRHSKGRWAGTPLGLEPFQLEVMSELLAVEREAWLELTIGHLELPQHELWAELHRWREEDADFGGLRVHDEGLLGISKKNGKSTMASGFALFMLVGDGEDGPEVYSAAAARKQAGIVFEEARKMVVGSPRLLEMLNVKRSLIEYPARDGIYAVLSADADVQEGINPSAVIVDEVHAHKNRRLYDTLVSATAAREQPLVFSITTAGISKKDRRSGELTIGGELYERGAGRKPRYRLRKLGNGLELSEVVPRKDKQREFYYRWFEVPWPHRESLRYQLAANPAPWIDETRLAKEASRERPRGIFYRYHCNIWTEIEVSWLKPGAWARCKRPRITPGRTLLEGLEKLGIVAGDGLVCTVDVGLHYDTTSLTVSRVPKDADEQILVRSWVWGVRPDDPKQPPPPAHELVDDESIDLDLVLETIYGLGRAGYRLRAVGGDPAKFEQQLRALDDRGFLTVRFEQGQQMVRAAELLYREIGDKTIEHDGDPVIETHMENAVARDVGGGRFRLDKKRATEKMDGAVSTAMNVYLCREPDVMNVGKPTFELL